VHSFPYEVGTPRLDHGRGVSLRDSHFPGVAHPQQQKLHEREPIP